MQSRQRRSLLGILALVSLGLQGCSSERPDFSNGPTDSNATSTGNSAGADTSSGELGRTDGVDSNGSQVASTSASTGSATEHEATAPDSAGTSTTDDGTLTNGATDDSDTGSDATEGDDTDSDDSEDVDTQDDSSSEEGALALGMSCTKDTQCASEFCADDVCCESACDEVCSACNTNAAVGQCVGIDLDDQCPALSCNEDTECLSYVAVNPQANCSNIGQCATNAQCDPEPADLGKICNSGEGTCDGEGECVVPNKAGLGEPCDEDAECGSDHCAGAKDGGSVCCDTACDGTCQACADDGHCTEAPADDQRCAAIDCEESTDCVTYPTDRNTNRCAGPGTCLTETTFCVADEVSADTECTESSRDGTCDGAGTCVPTPVCGDSITEANEECDDGNSSNTDSCTNGCKDAACGDGFVQATRGELCDDSNLTNGDGCSSECISGFAPKGSSMLTSVHLCGIRANRTMGCWGLNTSGQLGSGSTSSALETTRTVSNLSDAVDVALYGNTTCAVRSTGQVACWGSGFTSSPTVLSGISDAKQISAGDSVFCARRATGTVACWGTDGVVSEPYGYSSIIQVAQGNSHGCGIRGDGSIYCVGANAAGEGGRTGALGGERKTSATAASLLNTGTQLAAGYRYTCYIRSGGGSVECVGDSATLGNPSAASGVNPATVLNVPDPEKLASGGQHVCVLTKAGKVLCWGQGSAAGPDAVNATPTEVDLPANAIDVGAGSQTSCALLETGAIYCWGLYAPTAESETPVQITL